MLTQTTKGPIHVGDYPPAAIASTADFLDAMGSSPAPTMALRREHFHPDFFELRTGLACELIQKDSK